MAAQRSVYYLRVASKIVHAVQARHPDLLGIAERGRFRGASACVETLVCRQRSTSDVFPPAAAYVSAGPCGRGVRPLPTPSFYRRVLRDKIQPFLRQAKRLLGSEWRCASLRGTDMCPFP